LTVELTGFEAQTAKRVVPLLASALGVVAFALGGRFAFLPSVNESPQIVFSPTKSIQQFLIDALFLEHIGELVDDQVGLLAGVFKVGLVAVWFRFSRVAWAVFRTGTSLPATPGVRTTASTGLMASLGWYLLRITCIGLRAIIWRRLLLG
jgi:hypothetical protein